LAKGMEIITLNYVMLNYFGFRVPCKYKIE